MPRDIDIKICGLTSHNDISVLAKYQVRWAGFVFYPNSPRNIEIEHAKSIISMVPKNIDTVAVMSNPNDEELMLVKSTNVRTIQLHGDESPDRCKTIMDLFDLKIIKAFKILKSNDFNLSKKYTDVCDFFLFDAKPPQKATRPGGNAISFDWNLLTGKKFNKEYILSGGLDDKNVAEAISSSGCNAVDVSSGVENAPGSKDLNLIKKFCIAARK